MALILNIDTSTTVCSVALAKDGVVVSYKEVNEGYTHAENLTLFVQEVLKKSKYTLKDIDAFAVSKGPGSYTGLRIGVSSVKGFCFALQKPLIAIDTLKAMTNGAISQISNLKSPIPNYFCPMIDARRMEVYCAIYDKNLHEKIPTSAVIIDENSFSEILEKNQIVFFGDGAEKCREKLSHHKNALFIENIYPSAIAMAELSEQAFANNKFEDVAYFEPFYLKEFVTQAKKN